MSIVAVILGPWFIIMVYGSPFESAYPLLILLIPGFLATAGPIIVGPNLWGKGYPRLVIVAPYISFIIDITIVVLLFPILGIAGASIGSSVGYIIWALLLISYFKRNTNIGYRELLVLCRDDLQNYRRLAIRLIK